MNNTELLNALKEATITIGKLKRSMLAHPDYTKGSEFDDYTDTAQKVEKKCEEEIEKATS